MKRNQGFTLIELLVTVAILAVLAAVVLVAINPAKRLRQARDAKRKQDINQIANALIGHSALTGRYPNDAITGCDTSMGLALFSFQCPPVFNPPSGGDQWYLDTPFLYYSLVTQQGFLKSLPIDPTNNLTYYYTYILTNRELTLLLDLVIIVLMSTYNIG